MFYALIYFYWNIDWNDYRLNYLLHGLAPLGYHLGNLVLHLGVTLLYHSTLSSLLNSTTPALLAALLFSVHPVHTGLLEFTALYCTTMYIVHCTVLYSTRLGFTICDVIKWAELYIRELHWSRGAKLKMFKPNPHWK